MNSEKTILNELNKGIKMGMDSISNVAEKVQNKDLKENLQFQYNKYNELLNVVNNQLSSYGEFPKEVNPMLKAMGWVGIQLNTIDNKSDSKISEMMIQGLNMGIIEGVKLLNQNPSTKSEVKNILNDFVVFQQDSVEKLKAFL